MNIIIEGTNGSGKSTLAKYLSDVMDKRIIHAGGPSIDFPHCLIRSTIELGQMEKGSYIFDRVQPISYIIYQKPDSTREGLLKYYTLEMLKSSVLVYCYGKGSPEYHGKDHYDQNLIKEVDENQEEYRQRYHNFMDKVPCISYDFMIDNLSALSKEILNELN